MESKFYVPYIRLLQYLSVLSDNKVNPEDMKKIKQKLESIREADPKNVNKAGIVDFDLFMLMFIDWYQLIVNKAKEHVINAFAASDLDGNLMCNLDEWLLLNRHSEADKYDEQKFIKLFYDNADILTEKDKNLSFDRFTRISVENNLFSD